MMNKTTRAGICIAMTSLLTGTNLDAVILRKERFIPVSFSELHNAFMTPEKEDVYNQALAHYNEMSDVNVSHITYTSAGFQVTGFILEPADENVGNKRPVIVYCRGGSNNDGSINVLEIMDRLLFFARAGYIVVASQYRGNDGGQGRDAIGSVDVADTLSLIETLPNIPCADVDNIHIIGYSRGATVACMAVRAGAPVKTMVLWSGVFDYTLLEQQRPDLIPILLQMIECTSETRDEEYRKRSAVCWAGELTIPLLVQHGLKDNILDKLQSERFFEECSRADKEHHFILYPDADHSLMQNMDSIHQDTLEWFEKH